MNSVEPARNKQQTGRENLIKCAPVFLLILSAYSIRILYPDLYMTGGDMPGHIMASMRLHLTSYLDFHPLQDNFFAQSLQFNHGFTTITLPWILYEIVFNLFSVTITERTLVYIHSTIGLMSLLSVYCFARVIFDHRVGLTALAIMAFAPIHIGLSRAHVGLQLIYTIFFYVSLTCLGKYLQHKEQRWKLLYYAATLLYIGCDNAFMIGLLFQGLFMLVNSEEPTRESAIHWFKDIYMNLYALVSIGLPIVAYLAVTGYSLHIGIHSGYLLRLFSKLGGQEPTFDPIKVAISSFELLGPIAITFVLLPLSSTGRDNFRNNRNARYLLVVFGCYFLLLSLTNSVERNYVLFLSVPVVTLSAIVLSRKPPLLILLLGASILYSLAVVYRVNIGFQTPRNYGSIDPSRRNNDYGIKALGTLIRSGQLEVSRGSSESDPIGLFLDFEGAEYYLGARYRYLPMEHIQSGYLDEYEITILAFRHNDPSHENQTILETAKSRGLQPIGYILDGDQVLITLYSNKPTDKVRDFQLDDLNPRFDQEFGDLDRLPRTWLGRF